MTSIEQERENFLRNAILIVDHSKAALISLIELDIRNKHFSFEQFLNQSQHEIYHLCYNNGRCCRCVPGTSPPRRNRIIFPSQMEILFDKATKMCGHRRGPDFCCSLAKKGIGTDVLDLTLARCLLVNCCTDVFWYSCLQFQGISFEDFLNHNKHLIYHLWQYNHGCCFCPNRFQLPVNCQLVNTQEWNIMFTGSTGLPMCRKRSYTGGTNCICSISAISGISQGNLDIVLQQTILEYCCSNRKSVETLVKIRNNVYGHTKAARISDSDFTRFKNDIESSVLDIANVCGKEPEFKTILNGVSHRSLDHTLLVQYQNSLLDRTNDISELFALAQSSKKSSDQTMTKMQKLQETTENHMESSRKANEHTAAKLQKLEENTETTNSVIESSKKAEEHTASKLQKLDESMLCTSQRLETVETETKKVKEYVLKCETPKRSRLLGLTQTEIDGHLREGTFVETPAVQACIKLLETNTLLVLTGAAGTGKSRNGLEILHQFRFKHPEYETIKLTDLDSFTDIVTTNEKLVILFEDIFGRTNTRFAENTDVQIIDRIHACTIKGNIKTILTVRDTIRMSCDWLFTSHKIFHGKCEVDLSSKTYKITKSEKELLLLKYFFAHNFRLLELNEQENYFEETILDRQVTATVNRVTLHSIVETEPLLGFPEACSLFTGNRKLTRLGLSFFKHPSKYLYEEIEKLRINGIDNRQDSMNYMTLVYIFLNEDCLDPEGIDGEKCLEIFESCYGISCKKIPTCQIIDAANGMLGRYLIFHFDNGTYHFQHQTIFESILISYSRIDTGLILSRLSFDFIREMVRLQNYKQREGEIVLKIIPKHYSMLANRIIEIVQSEYFSKSLSLNFQLLCESQIIRENDEFFLKILIEKTHDAYFEHDYDLQKFVTFSGKCKSCQLYLPALLLERITQQTKMDKSIALLVDHLALKLDSESEEDIDFSCKSSLLEAFLHVCELENNENILDNIWIPLKKFTTCKIKENIRSGINRVCSRCPITTIKWIVNNIDRSAFDMNHILNTACEFKRLDVVQLLSTTFIAENGHGVSIHDNVFLHELDKRKSKGTTVNQLDFTAAFIAAIKNVWNDRDEPVSKWLIKNIPHQLFDMKTITMKVLEMKCMEDLKFLITNVDNCMLDMKLVYTNQYKEGRKSIENLLKWMAANVEQQKINILELNNLPIMVKDIEVVKYLFNNFDQSLVDWTPILMSAVNSDWRCKNKILIEWLISNVDLKYFEITKVIQEVPETNEHLLRLLLEKVNPAMIDITQIMNKACRFSWVDVVTWTLHNINHKLLAFEEPINIVLNSWKNDKEDDKDKEDKKTNKKEQLIKLFLEKVNNDSLDLKEILNHACHYGSLGVVKLVLKNAEHKKLDLMKAVKIVYNSWMHDNGDEEENIHDRRDKYEPLIKFILEKGNSDSLDLILVFNQACRYGCLDIVKLMLENNDHKMLDIMKAVNIIYSSVRDDDDDITCISDQRKKFEPLIKIMLDKVNHDLLDFKVIMSKACRYGFLDVSTFVLDNNDHDKLEIMEAVNILYSRIWNEVDDFDDIDVQREKYEPLIKLILEKVNNDLLDIKEIMNKACYYGCLDVVRFILDNIDLKECDMVESINIVSNPPCLNNMNHDSIVLKIMYTACCYGYLDVVTFVLENTDHKKIDIMEAVEIAYSSISDIYDEDDIYEEREKWESMIKLILEKADHDLLDLKEIMNDAFFFGFQDVVTFLLENADHEKLDIMDAVNRACYMFCLNEDDINRKIEKREPMIKLILEKADHDLLDLKEIMKKACRYDCLDVVTLLLENSDHDKLHIMKAVNTAYSSLWYRCDIDEQRKKKEPLIKLILEKVDHDLLELKEILNEACRYNFLDVVTFLLENSDHEKLHIMKAVNIAYSSISDEDDDDDDIYEKREKKEQLFKLILEKVDHDLLDLKEIMDIACRYHYLDVVTFLLENTDHEKLDLMEAVNTAYSSLWYRGDIDEQRKKKESLIKLILEKVDHDSLDLKKIMNKACVYAHLDVVTFLLENTDDERLDIMKAVNNAYNSLWYRDDIDEQRKKEPLIKLILEKVDHDLLDLKEIMNEACRFDCLDVVTFLLENSDHEKLHIMKAVNIAYSSISYENDDDDDIYEKREKKEQLFKLILEKVDHDLLDLKKIMDNACCYHYLDVVTLLLENTDHEKLDLMEAVYTAYSSLWYRGDIYEKRERNEPLIKLILQKVDHDSLDLKEIMNKACRYGLLDVVTFLLENTDHEKLDIMKSVNILYSSISDEHDDDDDIYEKRERNEHLIKLILEKVDHDLLDLKEIMDKACCYGYLYVVTFLLENTDHEKLNVMEAVNKACNLSIDEETADNSCNEKLIEILLQKVKTDLLDMEVMMNEACRNGWLHIVRWLVEKINHSMFDVDTAFNLFIPHDGEETLVIFKLLLQIISPNLFNIGTVIEQASRLNHTEKVLWLLQNKDSSLFEMKYVMNEACRNSNLQIMKYVMENMDKNCVDVRSAMNKACRSSKPNSLEAVKWLVENIPYDMLDLEIAMNNACRYDQVSVVEWFWNTLDRKLFNVRTAWNNACYNCNETLLLYLINTMDEQMLDKSKAMLQACRNYEGGDKVISLLFEQPNMNTPENCKNVLKEACVHSNRPIVKWLLENTDVQPSELKEMLIYNIKATINKSNNEEKSDHKCIVWFMLKHPKVKELERNDLSDVMEALSSMGQLDMVQRLWDNTEQSMFNMQAIVNIACESGKFEIVDWFLQNIELTNINVQTVMLESCGYGWLKIVKLLLLKFEKEHFDMRTSMNEACSYGRYEIVKFLLENVDSNLLDTKLVLENACGYGWKDIILWLFDNTGNISINSKECMFEACAQGRLEIVELFFSKYGTKNFDVNKLIDVSCNSRNADVVKFFIENFDLAQSHIDIIIKKACTYSWTEIVTSLIDVCKHNKNLMEEVMKTACINGETEIVEIFLNKVDTSFLGVNTNMNISCQKGWDEIVSLLLERVDHSLFDFTVAMNEACRCGEADVVELLIQKVNRENFNFDTAIVKACKSHLNENLVLILLKYINRSTSDIEAVSGKAYDYGWRRVSSRLKRMIYNDISK